MLALGRVATAPREEAPLEEAAQEVARSPSSQLGHSPLSWKQFTSTRADLARSPRRGGSSNCHAL